MNTSHNSSYASHQHRSYVNITPNTDTSEQQKSSHETKRSSMNATSNHNLTSHVTKPRPYRRSYPLGRHSTSISVLMGHHRRKKPTTNKDKQQSQPNTYNLEPSHPFNGHQIELLITDILEKRLQHVQYNPLAGDLATSLSDLIQSRVKALQIPRYKIVCQVIVGQNNHQGMEIASRCLWDGHRDNYACVTYHNESLSVVVNVHGIYFE